MAEKSSPLNIMKAGEKSKAALSKLIARDRLAMDVIGVKKAGKGWQVTLEVLERKAVPDSQDILGKYELKLDQSGELLGYKRVELRRRSSLGAEELEE